MNFVRSNGCRKNKVVLDLYDVVQLARKHDLQSADSFFKAMDNARSIPPTGFFYHEGRCGSTLVSNSAVALDPEKTRVYSEPININPPNPLNPPNPPNPPILSTQSRSRLHARTF